MQSQNGGRWIINRNQNLLSSGKKCISNKMYMIPAAVPQKVNYFKGRWTKYPTLDTAAKFMSRNLGILNNPKI